MTMGVLKNIKPIEVLKYFEELSQIPRGSGNEKQVSDYLVQFAKKHNLTVVQDKSLNVIIKKKATSGYENAPILILQGHMDMVCEKNVDTKHDFTKDPLKLRVVEDMLYATGTTLGADNGVAVAMGMAILASDKIVHPALELLVTVAEETGMDGAVALDTKDVEGRVLINMDSEEEGYLLVSCAGGTIAKINIDAKFEAANNSLVPCAIKIRGLKGGHSGMEIDKERGNSNKLMGRILYELSSKICYKLSSLNGGSKHNAIPREMDAVILVKAEDKDKVAEIVAKFNNVFKNELRKADPEVKVTFEILTNHPAKMLSHEAMNKVVTFLYLVPNGINSMSMDIKGLVESSLNLGVVSTNESGIQFIIAVRSSIRSLKEEIFERVNAVANLTGANVTRESDYPEWSYDPNSKIREVFINTYEKINGKKPQITAIHAGVECGLFKEKFGEIDMISFGPDMYDVHTPEEHFSISSLERSWNYLLEVLKSVK